MNIYSIYYTDVKGTYTAIKEGWSWVAFFFTGIWAFWISLWKVFFIVLIINIFINIFISRLFVAGSDSQYFVVAIIAIVISFIFGLNGNKWREERIMNQGYNYVGSINANNPKSAKAQWINSKDTESLSKLD